MQPDEEILPDGEDEPGVNGLALTAGQLSDEAGPALVAESQEELLELVEEDHDELFGGPLRCLQERGEVGREVGEPLQLLPQLALGGQRWIIGWPDDEGKAATPGEDGRRPCPDERGLARA